MIFARKRPEFDIKIVRKKCFPDFLVGGTCSSSPRLPRLCV